MAGQFICEFLSQERYTKVPQILKRETIGGKEKLKIVCQRRFLPCGNGQ